MQAGQLQRTLSDYRAPLLNQVYILSQLPAADITKQDLFDVDRLFELLEQISLFIKNLNGYSEVFEFWLQFFNISNNNNGQLIRINQ